MSDPTHDVVWEELRGTCVICNCPADVVHEILPKSLNRKHWQEPSNRVTLCDKHHRMVHRQGTRTWAEALKSCRSHLVKSFHGR